MAINYQPTQWNNEQEPPISADNLNHIEQGIKSIADRVDELVTVEANPSETPTDRLTALEVDGNIYEVGGGHKFYTDGGTLLPQQPNMVVKGVYSKDNSTDSITEIEVVREFQNDAEVQALTGEAAKGFQHTPDNIYRARAAADITFDPTNTLLTSTRMQEAMEELDAEHLPYSGTQNMKQKIDEIAYDLIESGIWICKKYYDGTLEIFGRKAETLTYDTFAWGNIHSHDFNGLGNYPIPFTSISYLTGSVTIDSANGLSSIKSPSASGVNELTTAPAYLWVRGTSATGTGNVIRTIHAVGRWKA